MICCLLVIFGRAEGLFAGGSGGGLGESALVWELLDDGVLGDVVDLAALAVLLDLLALLAVAARPVRALALRAAVVGGYGDPRANAARAALRWPVDFAFQA